MSQSVGSAIDVVDGTGGYEYTRIAPHCHNLPLPDPPARQLSKSFDASSHELYFNQYQLSIHFPFPFSRLVEEVN